MMNGLWGTGAFGQKRLMKQVGRAKIRQNGSAVDWHPDLDKQKPGLFG